MFSKFLMRFKTYVLGYAQKVNDQIENLKSENIKPEFRTILI